MRETDYAYAVARIRSNEQNLLNASDMEQLASAADYQSALHILEEKGWFDTENREDLDSALKNQACNCWKLLCEISPDISELDFLIIKNDYHNIKAALKKFVLSQISGADIKAAVIHAAGNYIEPSIIDSALIGEAVFNKNHDVLPPFAKEAVEKTYDVLIRTADGQRADIMLDSMSLDATMDRADKTKNKFIRQTAEIICATANIKTALRSARTGKDRQFLETALCRTETVDKASLAAATSEGPEELIDFISRTPYAEAAEHIRISTASFEKWCDDLLMSHIKPAKYICLGVEPLIAYYIAKDTEIKTVRIILSCKHSNIPRKDIEERVRELYV